MTTTTTITSAFPAVPTVVHDLYRDIHKGIRAELFALTGAAGSLDPADDAGRADLAAHLGSVAALLQSHAAHEDGVIQPVLDADLPDLAERIEHAHVVLDTRVVDLAERAAEARLAAPTEQRAVVHALYVDLAAFTSAYLEHQDVEERVVMPALEAVVGPDAVLALHQAIVGAIPPEEMAASLALMLPAMNVDDRAELFGGMLQSAPPEAFDGAWSLATSVLAPRDVAALAARLALA